MIPILYNHDATKVIGSYHDGVFTLIEGHEITRAQLFNCFGNCGFEIIESVIKDDDFYFIKKFRIHEWSLSK